MIRISHLALAAAAGWIGYTLAQGQHAEHKPPTQPQQAQAKAAPARESAELQRLRAERADAARLADGIDAILSALSFAARARAYCRLAMPDPQAERRYRDLATHEPATQEAEIARRREMDAAGERVVARRINLAECESMVVSGFQRMPSDDELRERAASARQAISEIEREMGRMENSEHNGVLGLSLFWHP